MDKEAVGAKVVGGLKKNQITSKQREAAVADES